MSRRLIDADKQIEILGEWSIRITESKCLECETNEECLQYRELIGRQFGIENAITLLEEAPTIDAVELPCKIGDKVWIARRYKCHKRPRWGIVSEMFFTENMELCIVVKGVARGKWGVDVFATYEEAEKQIEINNRKD